MGEKQIFFRVETLCQQSGKYLCKISKDILNCFAQPFFA
jgi:hypothetical protein